MKNNFLGLAFIFSSLLITCCSCEEVHHDEQKNFKGITSETTVQVGGSQTTVRDIAFPNGTTDSPLQMPSYLEVRLNVISNSNFPNISTTLRTNVPLSSTNKTLSKNLARKTTNSSSHNVTGQPVTHSKSNITATLITSNSKVQNSNLTAVASAPNVPLNASTVPSNVSTSVVSNHVYLEVLSNISSFNVQEYPKVTSNESLLDVTKAKTGGSAQNLSLNATEIKEDDVKVQNTKAQQNNGKINMDNNKTVDAEVPDLLKIAPDNESTSHQLPLEPEEPLQIHDQINDDTELIGTGENTEDKLRNHDKAAQKTNVAVPHGQLAGILVSTLIAVSVLSYAALLSWRKYLENKYGSRQMLVNEQEFDDPDDMGHFSI